MDKFTLSSYLGLDPETKPEPVNPALLNVEIPTMEELAETRIYDECQEAEIMLDAALTALDKLEAMDARFGDEHISEFTLECFMDELNVSTAGVIRFEQDRLFDKDGKEIKVGKSKVAGAIKKLIEQVRLVIKKMLNALSKFFSDAFNVNDRRMLQAESMLKKLKEEKASFVGATAPINSTTMPAIISLENGKVEYYPVSELGKLVSIAKSYSLDKNLQEAANGVDQLINMDSNNEKLAAALDSMALSYGEYLSKSYAVGREEERGGIKSYYLSNNPTAKFPNGFRILLKGANSSAMLDIESTTKSAKVLDFSLPDHGWIEQGLIASIEILKQFSSKNKNSVATFDKGLKEVLKDAEKNEGIPAERVRGAAQAGKFFSSLFRAEQMYLQRLSNAFIAIAAAQMVKRSAS